MALFCVYDWIEMNIHVVVHPNAKKARIEEDMLGTLHVYVVEPPLEGKANAAVLVALAKHLGKKKNEVWLVAGHTSKLKTFEVR